ncbi:MAG: hypothetical protein ACI9JR_001167, partial [Gammaproteobacteria bacterium]
TKLVELIRSVDLVLQIAMQIKNHPLVLMVWIALFNGQLSIFSILFLVLLSPDP